MQPRHYIVTFIAIFALLITLPVSAGGQEFLISVDETVWQVRKNRVHLVDVRPPEEFKRVSIPGSLNIPLTFIKTKPYLKTKPIVLINAGFIRSSLLVECRILKMQGFRASILDGGLLVWHGHGQALKGNLRQLRPYTRVTPAMVFREETPGDIIFVDVSPEGLPKTQTSLKAVFHIPFSSSPANRLVFEKLLSNTIKKMPRHRVVVCNQAGAGYPAIKRSVESVALKRVFYLEGGWQAYKHHTENYALIYRPREERIKSTSCNNCGPVEKK